MYTEQQSTTIIPEMAPESQVDTAPNNVSWAWTHEEGRQGNEPPPQPAVNSHAQGEPLPISTYSSIAMALDFSPPWPQAAALDQGSSQHVDTPLHNTGSDQQYSSVDGLIAESANRIEVIGHETSAVVPGTTDAIPMSLTPGRLTENPVIPSASSAQHSFAPVPAGEQPSPHAENNTNRADAASPRQPVSMSWLTFTTPIVRDVPKIYTVGKVRMNGKRERAAQKVHEEWEVIEKELEEGRDVSFHERTFIKSWDCYERVFASLLRCQQTNCPSRQLFCSCSSLRKHVKEQHYTRNIRPRRGETPASYEAREAVAKAEGEAKVTEDKYLAAMERFTVGPSQIWQELACLLRTSLCTSPRDDMKIAATSVCPL